MAQGPHSALRHYARRHAGIETRGGERFTIYPGGILLAQDNTGSGHRWKLIGDDPWWRAYVVYPARAALPFKARSPIT